MEKLNYFRGRAMEKFVAEGNVPRWNLHSVDSVLLYLSTTKISKKQALLLHVLKKGFLSSMDTSSSWRTSGPALSGKMDCSFILVFVYAKNKDRRLESGVIRSGSWVSWTPF
jgi:hypothetical protein